MAVSGLTIKERLVLLLTFFVLVCGAFAKNVPTAEVETGQSESDEGCDKGLNAIATANKYGGYARLFMFSSLVKEIDGKIASFQDTKFLPAATGADETLPIQSLFKPSQTTSLSDVTSSNAKKYPTSYMEKTGIKICMAYDLIPSEKDAFPNSAPQYACTAAPEAISSWQAAKIGCKWQMLDHVDFPGYDIGGWYNVSQSYHYTIGNCSAVNCLGMVCYIDGNHCWLKYTTHEIKDISHRPHPRTLYWHMSCA